LEAWLLTSLIGPLADNERRIQSQARIYPASITIHRDPPSMRELMLAADVASGGAGQTLYELAAWRDTVSRHSGGT